MTYWQAGSRSPAWWGGAVLALGAITLDLHGQLDRGVVDGKVVYFLAVMTLAVLVGLWAWAWRPSLRIGLLMFVWPLLLVAADLPNGYPDSRLVSTIGLATLVFGYIAWAQMALSYPTGKLIPGWLPWIYIFILGYAAQAIQNLVNMLYYDARGCPVCVPRVPTLIHIGPAPFSLDKWNDAWFVFIMAILPIGLYVLYRAYARATGAVRRSIGPVVATATVITCTSWVYTYLLLTDRFSALAPLSWVQTTGALAAALTALIGLGIVWRARGTVGDLVVELDRAGPGRTREAISRAVGDPTLELALWLPGRRAWVDEQGRPVELSGGPERAVTYVGDDLAALVHDPVLLDQPALLEAVRTAARLALENEQLHVELRAQLAELRESRARIVRAGDEERRRLERDLHDGAQQRLLGIGMALQLVRSRVDGNADVATLVDEVEAEVRAALGELRELAGGIHPAVLNDQGLTAALRTLAERASLPVAVNGTTERLPAHVETAVYFLVAEALANVTKHAHASRAWVILERRNGMAIVEVGDDGVGGAAFDGRGSGLRGLVDRVGAVDGSLAIESAPGHGTRLVAEIRCAS